MSYKYSVSLAKLIDIHNLTSVYLPKAPEDIQIVINEVIRPGLQIAGFFDYFDSQRLQVMGRSEFAYLTHLEPEELYTSMNKYFSHQPVAVVVARNIPIPDVMLDAVKKYEVPLLQTDLPTSEFVSAIFSTLNVELAPRVTRHGVLVEIYGEGVLILGESGVGKSETAMELVKRGHRLIADDAVEIRRVSARTLVGSAPKNIRHFMELRGIGIINVRQIFGIGAVKITQQIDMIIRLEPWEREKDYDRMGLEVQTTEILGNEVSSTTIPVKPGRNLAIIIEVAAMNHRQRLMGYNSARDLLTQLGMLDEETDVDASTPLTRYDGW